MKQTTSIRLFCFFVQIKYPFELLLHQGVVQSTPCAAMSCWSLIPGPMDKRVELYVHNFNNEIVIH